MTLRKRTHSLDGGTLRGRINVAMSCLRECFPKTRIVLLTPIHRGFATFGAKNVQPDEAYANELGLFIDDYVAAIKEAGNAETDRLHPSAAGHERIAEAISMAVGDLLK